MQRRTTFLFARLWAVGLATALLASLPAPPAQAQAEEREERIERAKEHYERGSRFYAQGRYKEAVRELKAAYDLSGETILLYNLAKAYDKLGDFDLAIKSYIDYLDLSPTLSASDRGEVERSIEELRRRKRQLLPELVIRSNPRGADIFLDSKTKLLGQTPDKFRVDPGPHRVFLEKKGFEPVEKDFVMPAGKPLILEFELAPVEEYGNVQIIANVTGARVFIDGKNVGITPYREMPSLKLGPHQVILEKGGFERWEQRVEVSKGRTSLVTVEMKPIERPSGAPAVIGWTSFVLGSLAVGGGAVAYYFAEQQFNDTELFDTLHTLEIGGYVGGGVLLTLAATLITYDIVRDDPNDDMDPTWRAGYGASLLPPPRLVPLVGLTPGRDGRPAGGWLGAGYRF